MKHRGHYCTFLFVLLVPPAAYSWGGPGHKIVAAIAEARLTPDARKLVRELVGDEPLSNSEIATWADSLRDPKKKPWHYVNIPFSAGGYDPQRDCPRGCAVATIERATADLERNESAMNRSDALRWLVHVVADIHQPLHAGDGIDRGGNGFSVRLGKRRQPTNFHHIWDAEIVGPLLQNQSPVETARLLNRSISSVQAIAWTKTLDPVMWAMESNREARAIYDELGHLPNDADIMNLTADYPVREKVRVATFLQRAGVRLAALLDRIARTRIATSRGLP